MYLTEWLIMQLIVWPYVFSGVNQSIRPFLLKNFIG